MGNIIQETVVITTTGGDGAAVGSGTTKAYNGKLLQVYLDYHASAPATTDVTITYSVKGGTILSVVDTNTDALFAPVKAQWSAGAAVTAYQNFPANQPLTISVAQANALTACVTATLWFEVE